MVIRIACFVTTVFKKMLPFNRDFVLILFYMSKTAFDLPRYLFLKYIRHAVVRFCVEDSEGDKSITAVGFHISDGLIVTARHVASQKIESIKREPDGVEVKAETFFFHDDDNVDLVVIQSDFHKLIPSNPKQKRIFAIPLGQYLDEWLEDDFVLSKVLVMGYPRIPNTLKLILVSAEAED